MGRSQTIQDGTGFLTIIPGLGIIDAYGFTVPNDGDVGYSAGCLFRHIDGSAGDVLYTNTGSESSCAFRVSIDADFVEGPASATDNEVPTFDGTTGKLIQAGSDVFFSSAGYIFNEAGADVDFRIESSVSANTFFVDGGTGNVGIGDTTPAHPLEVNSTTTGVIAGFYGNVGTAAVAGDIHLLRVAAAHQEANYGVEFGGIVTVSSPSIQKHDFIVRTNDGIGVAHTERFRVTSDGMVGIGTSSPPQALTVATSTAFSGILLDGSAATNVVPRIQLSADRDSSGQTAGQLYFFNKGAAEIAGVTALLGATDLQGELTFRTSGVERMRIDTTGNVGIGTASPSTSLHCTGAVTLGSVSTPSTPASTNAAIFCNTGEVKVIDNAGNVTTISPHDKDGPAVIYNETPGIESVVGYRNYYRGEIRWVNLEDSTLATVIETFATYNTRRAGVDGHEDLIVRDWDAEQQSQADVSSVAIAEHVEQWSKYKEQVAKRRRLPWYLRSSLGDAPAGESPVAHTPKPNPFRKVV